MIKKESWIMFKFILIIILNMIMLACSNDCKQSTNVEDNHPLHQTDLIINDTINDTDNKADLSDPTMSSTSTSYSQLSKHHQRTVNDNMRGFDPASEDDLDDNGMSRYFDNNDEEGWD